MFSSCIRIGVIWSWVSPAVLDKRFSLLFLQTLQGSPFNLFETISQAQAPTGILKKSYIIVWFFLYGYFVWIVSRKGEVWSERLCLKHHEISSYWDHYSTIIVWKILNIFWMLILTFINSLKPSLNILVWCVTCLLLILFCHWLSLHRYASDVMPFKLVIELSFRHTWLSIYRMASMIVDAAILSKDLSIGQYNDP